MIDPKCWVCKQELSERGALYFEPPLMIQTISIQEEKCDKHHICVSCNKWLIAIVRSRME